MQVVIQTGCERYKRNCTPDRKSRLIVIAMVIKRGDESEGTFLAALCATDLNKL